MINLLPYDVKSKISAARTNSIIFRYIVILLISAAFIAMASFGVYYLNQTTIDKINASATSPISTNLNDTELQVAGNYIKELQSFQNNILTNEIHYSVILNALSSSLPSGAIIEQIELSADILKNPIKLKVYATSMDILNSFTNALPKDIFNNPSITEQKEIPTLYSKYNYIGILNFTISKELKL